MIELRHLRKEYPNAIPLRDVNVTVNDGDIIAIIGPSGTGKSTLIRCINRLDEPTSGEIFLDGKNIIDRECCISDVRKKMGMVFQSFNLFNHLTVVENVMIPPMDLLGMSRQDAYDRAMKLLHRVGMDGRAMNYPDMLSGGQKQRVAIARALSMDPEIILFDEPTSALDPTMVGEVQAVIRDMAGLGKTMMIVTHEMKFAREIATRVFYMDDGGIYEDGTPEQIFVHPEKELTRRFIHHLKVFETKIEGPDFDFPETVGLIDNFGFHHHISPKIVYRIQAVFEELCRQILLPSLEDPKISFTAEYSEEKETVHITVLYNGEPFDPEESGDALSLAIIKNAAGRMEHSLICDGVYTNSLTFEI